MPIRQTGVGKKIRSGLRPRCSFTTLTWTVRSLKKEHVDFLHDQVIFFLDDGPDARVGVVGQASLTGESGHNEELSANTGEGGEWIISLQKALPLRNFSRANRSRWAMLPQVR